MFKLSKKADYGLIAVKHLATHRNAHACSANEISEEYGISTTLMAKVLQKLARNGVVAAKHGSGADRKAWNPCAVIGSAIARANTMDLCKRCMESPFSVAAAETHTPRDALALHHR